jgi:outer membrane protein insertion porin family
VYDSIEDLRRAEREMGMQPMPSGPVQQQPVQMQMGQQQQYAPARQPQWQPQAQPANVAAPDAYERPLPPPPPAGGNWPTQPEAAPQQMIFRGQYTSDVGVAPPDTDSRLAPVPVAPPPRPYYPPPGAYYQQPAPVYQQAPPPGYQAAPQAPPQQAPPSYAQAPLSSSGVTASPMPGAVQYQSQPATGAPSPPPPGYQQQPYAAQPPVYGNQVPAYGNQLPPPAAQVPVYGSPQPVPGPQSDPRGYTLWPQLPIFGTGSNPMEPSPNGDPLLRDLDLRIRAEETQTGRVMVGVGVNSDAGLMGNIVLDEQNFDWQRVPNSWQDFADGTAFRGAGEHFRIEADPGTEVQRYMISFTEPFVMNTNVSMSVAGFYYDRIYTQWTEGREGGNIKFGYQLTHDLTAYVGVRAANVNISNPIVPTPLALEEVIGNNALYGFQVGLAHDTRDNQFLATEGHLFEISYEEVIGSFQYPHVEMSIEQYFKLYERADGSGRHVLSLTAKAGYTGDDTPIFERYFAGGFSSIRGFEFRGVSPIDPATGVQIGGDFQLLTSAQYLFPITADDMLRGVVFCDSGTVEPTISNWSDKYRVAPGFGLRIAIPAMGPAPIALDFAFPVVKQAGDLTQVFSFFVGFNH